MSYRPQLLPKVRAKAIRDAIGGKPHGPPMPCTARISSIVPGHQCSAQATVVPAHIGRLGKGTSTKVSDLNLIAACHSCHDLIDGRDNRLFWLLEHHPTVLLKRLLDAQHETLAMLVAAEVITIKGATFV